VGLGLSSSPAAADGFQPIRMGVKSLQFAQLATAGEIDGEGEIRKAAALGARLKYSASSPERLGQRQALGNILGARLLAINVFPRIGGHDGRDRMPVG